jgi:hypothetical protein
MRQISLRGFRTRGSKALEAVPQGETILLSGQQGPAYFWCRCSEMSLWRTGNCGGRSRRQACARVGSMPSQLAWTGWTTKRLSRRSGRPARFTNAGRRSEARCPGHKHNRLRRDKARRRPCEAGNGLGPGRAGAVGHQPLDRRRIPGSRERPKFHRFGFPPLWLEFLIEESMRLPDPPRWPYAGPGPKDIPFHALAHSAGAWLVTGNLRHFPEETRGGVTVLSPTDYLAHLER